MEIVKDNLGRIVLYVALAWTVFVIVKAIYEIHKHTVCPFNGDGQGDPNKHRRAHIVGLLGIIAVCIMQLVGYIWFDLKNTGLEDDDRTIGVFNILAINLHMLFNINHFRSERQGKKETGSWFELLKF